MSKNVNDDDMPPELEDLPEDLIKSKKEAGNTSNKFIGDYAQVKKDYEEDKQVDVQNPQKTTIPPKKDTGSISGFKKGFLNSKPEPKKVQEQTIKKPEETKKNNNQNDIVTIKANSQSKDSKVIPEVQEAMKMNQTLLEKKDQWMTPEFLKKIAENPSLSKLFTNPEYMQAITMMQKNPQEVMARYKNNKEFMDLLSQFSTIMGSHFIDLGKKANEQQITSGSSGNNSKNNTEVNAVLMDKEVNEILNDTKVKSFLEYLQKNQKVDFHRVMQSDPDLARKIKILIDKKLIQIQSY